VKRCVNLLLCSMVAMSTACGGAHDPAAEDLDAREAQVIAKDLPPFACAGFLGIACPGDYQCIDDYRDDCDPDSGGADCSGLCAHSKRPVACDPYDPVCDAGETCVDNPWLDCVAAPCPTGTCVLVDWGGG